MKKYITYIIVAITIIVSTVGLTSCESFLDIVPDETPKVDDFFVNRTTAERFLFSLYSNASLNKTDVPDQYSISPSSDLIYCSYFSPDRPAGVVMGDRGTWSASSVVGDIWGTNAANIRQCYVFLEKINDVPGINDTERARWQAEAKFLIAFMHFQILRQYGPCYLATQIYSLNETMEELSDDLYRRPFDECIEWIVDLMEEAANDLPESNFDIESSYFGKPSKVAILSLISRIKLYAASPLYNGNTEMADFLGIEGENLINQQYDESKWQDAASAAKLAIETAENAGHTLYNNFAGDPQKNYRMALCDPWNDELIWGASKPSSYGKSSAAYFAKTTMPVYVTADEEQWGNNTYMEGWVEFSASMKASELFYTENGLPIEQDPTFDYENRMSIVPSTKAAIIGETGNTLSLHENRDPRFYASIGYDRGLYYSAGDTTMLKIRLTEKHGIIDVTAFYKKNVPATGYYIQKNIHPEHSWVASFGEEIKYPWPLIRLAELYLNYAEALNESGENQSLAISNLNKIRLRAGIPTIEDSWGKSNFTKDELRKIIQQERSIELCFEGHRQWDMKRWKRLEELYDDVEGLKITSQSELNFNMTRIVSERESNKKFYFFPIYYNHLARNQFLVQSPGW